MLLSIKNLIHTVSHNTNLESIISKILSSGYYALANDPKNKLAFLDDQTLSKKDQVEKLLQFFEEEIEENHEESLDAAFEEYIQTWRKNHPKKFELIERFEQEIKKMREEREKAKRANKLLADQLINSLKEKCKPLEVKLRRVQTVVRGCARVGALGAAALRFGRRKKKVPANLITGLPDSAQQSNGSRLTNPSWYHQTETFLVDYIEDKKSEDELARFLEKEDLAKDFHYFQDYVCPWAKDLLEKTQCLNLRPLKIASVEAELKRMKKFVFALVLNDQTYLREHQDLVADVMKTTIKGSRDESSSIFPSISFGQLPLQNGEKQRILRLRFVLDESCTHKQIQKILEKFDNIKRATEEVLNNRNIIILDVVIDGSDSEFIANHIAVLSDFSIRGVLIGSFGIEMGDGVGTPDSKFRHCMNPSYNRIYSNNFRETAEGFMPTWFASSLKRGGEDYFCPVGWRRYGIDVGMTSSEFEEAYGDWPVAYHGTAGHLAWTILLAGLQASGEGCYLNPGEGCVYLSPSIEYCGHPRYSRVWKIKNQYVQMVLQVRVKETRIFERKPETLLKENEKAIIIDPNFKDNRELEWMIKWPPGGKITSLDGLLIYGLMLRVTDEDPRNLTQCRWWADSLCMPEAFD